MFSFLAEFTRGFDSTYTIIVMDEEGLEPPRQYRVLPRQIVFLLGGTLLAVLLLVVGLIVLTPVRQLIPGYGADEVRQDARMNALRLAALQDSLAAQQEYMTTLRQLLTGEIDSSATIEADEPEPEVLALTEPLGMVANQQSSDWADHEQPALPIAAMPASSDAPFRVVANSARYLSSLQFPLLPPIEGFLTRGFDARTGHFAVDFAVPEGTVVRSIGDGYVVFSDWSYEGGYTIAIQHADGYVSVYKHNQRLLKRTGDHVRAREVIATSGNSGETSTGPHLHFELWHDGLAQDPHYYFIGE